MYYVRLKEPRNLARAEIKALCGANGVKCRISGDFAVLGGKIPFELLVFSKFACEEVKPEDARGSFKIEGTTEEIRKYAPKFTAKVDLEHPKNIIRICEGKPAKEVWHFGKAHRTFVYRHHLTLDSELARFLVNLSRVKEGQKLLDPFCGTGSILIEAGKMGAKGFGSDIDDEMIFYARENLWANRLKAKLLACSVSNLRPDSFSPGGSGGSNHLFDAVVTDLPYGRCSALHGKKKEKIYDEALNKISKILKPKGTAVLLLDRPLKTRKLKPIARYKIREHKSLTRYANVFKK